MATQGARELTLYVSGAAPRSSAAITAVRAVCDEDHDRSLRLSVVDAAAHPAQALRNDVVALPTLVLHGSGPLRHLVGDLTDPGRVRRWLDQEPRSASHDPQTEVQP